MTEQQLNDLLMYTNAVARVEALDAVGTHPSDGRYRKAVVTADKYRNKLKDSVK